MLPFYVSVMHAHLLPAMYHIIISTSYAYFWHCHIYSCLQFLNMSCWCIINKTMKFNVKSIFFCEKAQNFTTKCMQSILLIVDGFCVASGHLTMPLLLLYRRQNASALELMLRYLMNIFDFYKIKRHYTYYGILFQFFCLQMLFVCWRTCSSLIG